MRASSATECNSLACWIGVDECFVCHTQQHTKIDCNRLQHTGVCRLHSFSVSTALFCCSSGLIQCVDCTHSVCRRQSYHSVFRLHLLAVCNTLQHTATDYNALQHAVVLNGCRWVFRQHLLAAAKGEPEISYTYIYTQKLFMESAYAQDMVLLRLVGSIRL